MLARQREGALVLAELRAQSRERPPFEAPAGEDEASQALPSLIGADTRNFGVIDTEAEPEPEPEEPDEAEDIPEDRWARPT